MDCRRWTPANRCPTVPSHFGINRLGLGVRDWTAGDPQLRPPLPEATDKGNQYDWTRRASVLGECGEAGRKDKPPNKIGQRGRAR